MKINKKKSGVMLFRKYAQNKKHELGEIEGIPIVKEYKYLGIYIDNLMRYTKQIENTKKKIEKATQIIKILK